MSFDAFPADEWRRARTLIACEWPRELAMHDLRYHAAQHALHGAPLPSLRELAEVWRWPNGKDRVARLIASAVWRDVKRPWGWGDRLGENEGSGSNLPHEFSSNATATRQQRDSSATPDQPATPINREQRDTDATATRQPCDSRARSSAAPDHPSPITQDPPVGPPAGPPAGAGSESGPYLPQDERSATDPGAESGEVSIVAQAGATAAETPFACRPATPEEPAPRKSDPRADLYRVLQAAQPRRSPTPTAAALRAMGVILREAGSSDRAEVYLAWVHQSSDRYARQIRGEEPWPDGDVTRRMDPESLARSLPKRLDAADTWHERGRAGAPAGRVTTPAAPTTTRPNPFGGPNAHDTRPPESSRVGGARPPE